MKSLCATGCAVSLLVACAPALDWRSVPLAGLGITVAFPCRPSSQTRDISLGGKRLSMTMHVCKAESVTFALSSFDAGDVRSVDDMLVELRAAALRNVNAEGAAAGEAFQVPGMTPYAHTRRLRVSGQLPNGAALTEHMAVFARGTRVYQAVVAGAEPPPSAVQTFFDGIRLDL